MKAKLLQLIKELLYEELYEISTTSGAGQYSTPFAFSKKNQKGNRAVAILKKIGYKQVERPKRPSNTKLFTFLQEGTAIITTSSIDKKVANVLSSHFRWVTDAQEREDIRNKIKDAFIDAYKIKGFTINEDK